MNEIQLKIQDLEYTVVELKKEIRRIKTTINKVEKVGLSIPSALLFKKEDVEIILKERKQELKLQKKIVELIK